MMNGLLVALVGLLETAVNYSIAAVLLVLLLLVIIATSRWLLGYDHSPSRLSRSA